MTYNKRRYGIYENRGLRLETAVILSSSTTGKIVFLLNIHVSNAVEPVGELSAGAIPVGYRTAAQSTPSLSVFTMNVLLGNTQM